MKKVIKSLDSPCLKRALDNNNISFWSSFGRYREGIINPDPDFFWIIAGIPLYSYNGVMRSRLSPEKFHENYNLLLKRFGDGKLPLIWWVSPDTQPPGTSLYLSREGWKDEGFFPAMAAELGNNDEGISIPHRFSIKQATSPEDRKLWIELMSRAMGFSEKVITKAVRVDTLLEETVVKKQKRFIGFLGAKPVGTSLMLPDSGVAGIFGVATLPEARGLGIGKAMTRWAMLEGKKSGFQAATLVATPMGEPVYQKLGFQKIFSFHCFSLNS